MVDGTINKSGVGGKIHPRDSIRQEEVALIARMTGWEIHFVVAGNDCAA
jgi:hypothetical protein